MWKIYALRLWPGKVENMQALCVTTVMFLPFDITEKLSNFSPILDEMSRKYNVFFLNQNI